MNYESFVINLERNTDRLAFMTNRLRTLQIPFTRFPAIDGKKYDFTEKYDDTCTKMTPGELGCSLSHQSIYQKIVDENIPYTLIFEDDVTIDDALPHIIEQELAEHRSGNTSWEFLTLNYTQPSGAMRSRLVFLRAIFTQKGVPLKQYFRNVFIFSIKSIAFFLIYIPAYVLESAREILYKRIFRYGKSVPVWRSVYFSGCYLITTEGARKMLAVSNKIIVMPDNLPNIAKKRTGLHFYKFVPCPVFQLDTFVSENR